MKRRLISAGIAASFLVTCPAAAGDLTNVPASPRALADFTHLQSPRREALKTITIRGQDVSLNASGKYALSRKWNAAEDFSHAEAMSKVLPGYPRPPIVMIDAKISF